MGISARQVRHQGAIRAAILDAALSIAAEGGWSGVTMRRIAARIEYSPAALYTHFPAKRDLMVVLARLAFATLADRLRQVQEASPERQLRTTVGLIWDFAAANHTLYDLMFARAIFDGAAAPPEAGAVTRHLREVIAAVAGSARNDLDDLTDILWAATTGLIAQMQVGRVAGGAPRARHLLDHMVGDFLAAWRSR